MNIPKKVQIQKVKIKNKKKLNTNIISNFYIDDYNISSTPVIDAGDKVCFGISVNSADDDDSDNSYDTDNALGIDYDKLSKAFSDALGIDYEYEPDYSDNNIMG